MACTQMDSTEQVGEPNRMGLCDPPGNGSKALRIPKSSKCQGRWLQQKTTTKNDGVLVLGSQTQDYTEFGKCKSEHLQPPKIAKRQNPFFSQRI